MKYLITVLLLLTTTISSSFANHVPLSEAQRYIAAAPQGVPALFTCEDKPKEPCLDFSHIEGWDVAEIVEVNGEYMLVNSGSKLTEKLNKENLAKAQKEAKKAKKDALKNTNFDDIKTIAALKEVVKTLIETRED
jgi:hypothetical protein